MQLLSFNLNMPFASIQATLQVLSTCTYDVSGCLTNCSNNGQCGLNPKTQQYACQCFSTFVGSACQTDSRPCSSFPCFNRGTCFDLMNETIPIYRCECNLDMFYGKQCEKTVNMCKNVTCSGHGICKMTSSGGNECKCQKGYEGDECDLEEMSLKIVKVAKTSSVTIVCISFGVTIFTIVANDIWNFCLMRKEKRDKKKTIIKHFKYYPGENSFTIMRETLDK